MEETHCLCVNVEGRGGGLMSHTQRFSPEETCRKRQLGHHQPLLDPDPMDPALTCTHCTLVWQRRCRAKAVGP